LNAPTITIIKNTLGSIVWTRVVTGSYTGTLNLAFPYNKTSMYITNGGNPPVFLKFQFLTDSSVNIQTRNISGALADDLLLNSTIEIKVYN
jgi:hypothetical protein